MAIWWMRIACWIPKATNTHSSCIILVAFHSNNGLHERASMLRCTYIDCVLIFVYIYVTLYSTVHWLCSYFCFYLCYVVQYSTLTVFLFLFISKNHNIERPFYTHILSGFMYFILRNIMTYVTDGDTSTTGKDKFHWTVLKKKRSDKGWLGNPKLVTYKPCIRVVQNCVLINIRTKHNADKSCGD